MHRPPIALVIAKKGAGCADFSGPTMAEARRELMLAPDPSIMPDLMPEPDQMELTPDDHSQLMDIVAELRKASETHAGQADRIEEICKRHAGSSNQQDDSPDQSDDDAGTGEVKVFEPAE